MPDETGIAVAGRLPFELPEFVRTSWVSTSVRESWKPRFARIRDAYRRLEWLTVAHAMRPCALMRRTPREMMDLDLDAGRGLAIRPLSAEGTTDSPYSSGTSALVRGRPELLVFVVGTPADCRTFGAAWNRKDHVEMGHLLGYPDCCVRSFLASWKDKGERDPTWSTAAATAGSRVSDGGRSIALASWLPFANILWRWQSLRAVFHLPCSLSCALSQSVGEAVAACANETGYAQEVGWLREILRLSVEWTALHGILEAKTPIVKWCAKTDATAAKLTVRLEGESTSLSPQGQRFPFLPPTRSQSAARERGLSNDIVQLRGAKDRRSYEDNGFSSAVSMRLMHRRLVELVSSGGAFHQVIDLGCGNGALLASLMREAAVAVPFGIDASAEKIARVHELLPQHAGNFAAGDLFDERCWPTSPTAFDLVLVSAARARGAATPLLSTLRRVLRSRARRVLLYDYAVPGAEPLLDAAQMLGLRPAEGRDNGFGMLMTPIS